VKFFESCHGLDQKYMLKKIPSAIQN